MANADLVAREKEAATLSNGEGQRTMQGAVGDAGSPATALRARPGVNDAVSAKEAITGSNDKQATPGNDGQHRPNETKPKHSTKVPGGTPTPSNPVTLASLVLFEKITELENKAVKREIAVEGHYGYSVTGLITKRRRLVKKNSAKNDGDQGTLVFDHHAVSSIPVLAMDFYQSSLRSSVARGLKKSSTRSAR